MNRRRRGVTSESFLIPIKAERDLIFLEERNDNVCVLEAVETILLFFGSKAGAAGSRKSPSAISKY